MTATDEIDPRIAELANCMMGELSDLTALGRSLGMQMRSVDLAEQVAEKYGDGSVGETEAIRRMAFGMVQTLKGESAGLGEEWWSL